MVGMPNMNFGDISANQTASSGGKGNKSSIMNVGSGKATSGEGVNTTMLLVIGAVAVGVLWILKRKK